MSVFQGGAGSRLLCLLSLMVTANFLGCAHTRSEVASKLSDYWECRAQHARYNEAEKAHARQERAKENALSDPQGTLKDVVKSEYTITLEKGMEIESVNLDFDKVKEMAQLQEEMDKAHDEAMKAYGKLVADAERKRLANYMANAQADANGANGCQPKPDCSRPEQEQGMAPPPPKRNALGMENLPIVIRARYSLTPRETSFAKTEVERRYQPGKAPCQPQCCPKCGKTNCTHSECCTDSVGQSQLTPTNEPAIAPASEVRRQLERRNSAPQDIENDFDSGVFDPPAIGSNLFRGELKPIMLSFEE